MSGTAAVPNSFQNAVTATGLQLDSNFTTIVAYVNDPTNRNNYANDGGGATNTVALTFAPPVVGGYTTGLELTWKWSQTNTGAVAVNANGLGNISVVNPDGTALQAGQGKAGSIGKAVYDGTRAIYIAQSAQRGQDSKAWCAFDGTLTGTNAPQIGFNVTNVIRTGTGSYSISFTTPFATVPIAVSGMTHQNSMVTRGTAAGNTSTLNIEVVTLATQVPIDRTYVAVICFGTQ